MEACYPRDLFPCLEPAVAHLQDSTTSLPWINRRLTSTIYTPHHSFPFHTSRPNPWGSPEDAGSADRHPQPTLSRVDAQGAMASKPEIPWTVVAEWKYARVRKQLANGSASDESDDLEKEHGLTGIKGSVSYRQPYVLYVDGGISSV
ncbi:hypothetical protein VPH35_107262 [Triticum aestivum]|uniref:uncharacterized protein isoform X4 n=1 Tax=Triticum aestivum TaxID=4565 RepID=UPI0008444386|nr:uncharacterized protein LOC123129116 isoform X4 [Triticum aestivum]